MSQQEFESPGRSSSEEVYRPQYPYGWSDQPQREGQPRDEPYVEADERRSQVPWWARPQHQSGNGSAALLGLILLLILVALFMGGLGIVGLILGSLAHILGIILGAVLLLVLFIFVFILIVLSIIGRALGRALDSPGRRWRNW